MAPTPKQFTDQQLVSFSPDDEGNAQTIKLIYGDYLVYTTSFGWLVFNGKHWEHEGAEAAVHRMATECLKERRLAAVRLDREDIAKVARRNRRQITNAVAQLADLMSQPLSVFDNDPDLLNCKNGVLDLRTGNLVQHNPSQMFTYVLPVEYDPRADCTDWLTFLQSSVADPNEVLSYLQEAVGYSLTGRTSEECLFYVYGPTRAGKGVFTEVKLALMGKPLAAGVRFETVTRDRSSDANNADLAVLRPCRLITASESSRHTGLNAALVKTLTGGDEINCSLKYRDHFSYRPQFKIWLSSNWPLNVDVDDDAAWGRVRVISFPSSNLGKEDKSLKRRLTSEMNLRGVLRWAVEGAMRWYARQDGLVTPGTVKLTTQKHRDELDTIQQFLDESVVRKIGAIVTNALMREAYEEWCKRNGVSPKYQASLTQGLKAKGLTQKPTKVQSKTVRAWIDVDLI